MGLLDKIDKLQSGVYLGRVAGVANTIKAILCLPALIGGFISAIPNVISGLISDAASAVNNIVNTGLAEIQNLVVGKVNEVVNKVKDVVDLVSGFILSIAGVINDAIQFVADVEAIIRDLLDFEPTAENCKFSAAELDACITRQIQNSLTPAIIRDISTGVLNVQDVARAVSGASAGQNNLTVSNNIVIDTSERLRSKHNCQLNRIDKINTKYNA